MKSIRLNIRALAFEGNAPLPSTAKIIYGSKSDSYELIGSGGGPLAKFGLLRMRDLVAQGVIGATDHVYVSWAGHSGQAGVTSFVVRSHHLAQGRRMSTSPARESDPSTGTSQVVGPFSLGPSDELVLTSNAVGEQLITLALVSGSAVEVESLVSREQDCYAEIIPVELHASVHAAGGADQLDVTGLSGQLAEAQTPVHHAASHQNNGADQLNVTSLLGVLIDPQNPTDHKASHQSGGGDPINVTGLSGLLADPQDPLAHKLSHQNGGGDQIDVTGLSGQLADEQLAALHKTSHQHGGADELDVSNLSGVLADPQTPLAHRASHQDGGLDKLDVTGLSGLLADPQAPLAHNTSHQNGQLDELDVTGLSGLLADAQTPLSHASTHQNGGTDQLSVSGLSGVLIDAQTPISHASTHQKGGADELNVTGLSGLLADKQTPASHKTSHQNSGGDELDVTGLSGLLADPQTPKPEVVLLMPADATLDPGYSTYLTTIGTTGGYKKPAISYPDPDPGSGGGCAYWFVPVPQAYATGATVTMKLWFCRANASVPGGNIAWLIRFEKIVSGATWSSSSWGTSVTVSAADSGTDYYGQSVTATFDTSGELDSIQAGDLVLIKIETGASATDTYTGTRLLVFAEVAFATA